MARNSELPIDFGAPDSPPSATNTSNTYKVTRISTAATHENVNFPLSQSPETADLVKQAELTRRLFLHLIEKYNLSPSVILHALYLHSGNVDACEKYLSDPEIEADSLWSLDEDHLILTDSDVSQIINSRGLEALRERRTFLHQVCEEAIGNWSEITTKLK